MTKTNNITAGGRRSSSIGSIKRLQSTVSHLNQTSGIDIGSLLSMLNSKFLRKTVDEVSYKPITVHNTLTVDKLITDGAIDNYINGIGAILSTNPDGTAKLTIDDLAIRRTATFNEVVIQQLSHTGGIDVVSAANIVCTGVSFVPYSDATCPTGVLDLINASIEDTDAQHTGVYRCLFDNKNGNIPNLFVIGDVALSQTFNFAVSGSYDIKYYRRRVVGIGFNYIDIEQYGIMLEGNNESFVSTGDNIVQWGHLWDKKRQSVVEINTTDGGRQSFYKLFGDCRNALGDNADFSDYDSLSTSDKELLWGSSLWYNDDGKNMIDIGHIKKEDGTYSDMVRILGNFLAVTAVKDDDGNDVLDNDGNTKYYGLIIDNDTGDVQFGCKTLRIGTALKDVSDWFADGGKIEQIESTADEAKILADTDNTQYIYIRTNTDVVPNTPTSLSGSWTDDYVAPTDSLRYSWRSKRTRISGTVNWNNYETPTKFFTFGEKGQDGATIIPVYKLGEAQPEIPADAVSELPEGWSFEMPEYNYTALTYEGWGEDWTSTERGVFEYSYNNEPWREGMSLFSYLEISVDASKDFDLTIQNTGEEGAAPYLVLSSIGFENMAEMQDYVLGAITAGNEYVVPRMKGASSVYLAAIGSGSASGSIALQGLLDEPVTEIKGAEVTYTTSVEYNTNNFTQASSEGGTITYDYVGAAMGDDWGGYLRLEFDSPEAFELTIENTSYASAGTVARFNVQSINTEPYASTDIMVVLSPTDENSAMVSIPKGESFLSVIATEPTTARASEGSLQLSGIPATTQLDHVYDPSVWVSMVSLKDEQYYFRAPYKPKGDEGKQGVSAAPYSYRGEWSASNTYYNNDACRDAVRYGDLFYRYVGINATQSDTFNEIDWDAFVGNFENIATGLLLAQEAFIDNLGVGRVKTINEDGNTVVDISNTLAKFGDFNVNPATGEVNIKDESGDVKVTMSRKAVSTAFNPQVEILDDINYATNFITPVKISDDIVIDSNTAIAVSGSLYASATSGMLTMSGTNSSIETTTTVTLYLYKDNALVEEIASTDVVADWYESIEVTGVKTETNQEAYNYQSGVLEAGTYDIRAKVMKSTGLYILESVIHPPQSSGKVLDTKITTLDGLGQLVIAPNTLTMLLNATNYGAIYIKDGELCFDFKGDSWKSSGALCSARIDVSAKSIVKQWGGAGVFDRVTYSSTSGYYLYHNLGHSNYIATCTPYGSTTSSVKVMYEGVDYVRVMADGDFNITMTGEY